MNILPTENIESTDIILSKIKNNDLASIHKIQTCLLKEMHDFMYEKGFLQLMPILMSPLTDPLNHSVYPATIKFPGKNLQLTASMIFHKQLSLISKEIDKIYIVSPNIRLELPELKSSENHLLEFSQFDIEMKNKDMWEIMSLVENLLSTSIKRTQEICSSEFTHLKRNLPEFKIPFPVYSSDELHEKYGPKFEAVISEIETVPCFITNFKREFYDKEDSSSPKSYLNFDLIYPEGFGEGVSGAEREYEHQQIIKRMTELDMDFDAFELYLDMAKREELPRTAGCGIGIQRLVRYLSGKRQIADVCLFDRTVESPFIF